MSESGKIHVLFVSDDPENKYSVKSLIENIPCEVECCRSRIRAGKLLSVIQFNLIIADIEIPKTTGANFCKAIRSDKKNRNIPIIVVGVDDKDGTQCIAALEAGSDDFIEFPFIPPVFLARAHRLLKKKTSQGAKAFLSVQVSSGDLPGILQYLEAEIKTGKLNIKRNEDSTAVLYFNEGRLVNATAPYCAGIDAVTEVLSWESSHVTFQELELEESEIQFDFETTGTIMNCVVDVDEFREIQKSIPAEDVMFHRGTKKPDTSMDVGQIKIYELALKGYSTDDLLSSQKINKRKATLWLHQLIEEGYLSVAPAPFQNYLIECHETYKNSQIFIKRLNDIKTISKAVAFPLPEISSSIPFGASDWLSPAPRIIVTGDDFGHVSLLAQSFSRIATYTSQTKSLVRKHLKGLITTRLFFDPKEMLDIEQLPPGFDKLIMNSLNEVLTDVYAVIFVASAQDKKTSQENLRALRVLRQRFKGIYYFIVPQAPNKNNVSEFRIDCTHCDNKLAVDMAMAGAVGACPICNASLTIPDCLDHLAHTLQLPDDVPVAQLMPGSASQCRDLLLLIIESVLNALELPQVPPVDTESVYQENELENVDVRERLHSSNLQILAAVDDHNAFQQSLGSSDPSPDGVKDESDQLPEEEYGEISLDDIINTEDDQFDIDEFIKSVRRVR